MSQTDRQLWSSAVQFPYSFSEHFMFHLLQVLNICVNHFYTPVLDIYGVLTIYRYDIRNVETCEISYFGVANVSDASKIDITNVHGILPCTFGITLTAWFFNAIMVFKIPIEWSGEAFVLSFVKVNNTFSAWTTDRLPLMVWQYK